MQGFILFPHSFFLLEEVCVTHALPSCGTWWNPSMHTSIKSIDLNIQFTVESESEGKVPFLDVLSSEQALFDKRVVLASQGVEGVR